MKRIPAVFLLLAIMISLAACSGQSTPSGARDSASSGARDSAPSGVTGSASSGADVSASSDTGVHAEEESVFISSELGA